MHFKNLLLTLIILCAALCSHAQFFQLYVQYPYPTFSINPIDTGITLLFAFDKYDLDSLAKQTLRETYNRFIKNDSVNCYAIHIEGFTDYKGSDAYNYTLSENRANEVGKYLIRLSGDTVLRKTDLVAFETPCNGTCWCKSRGTIIPQFRYYGKGRDTSYYLHSLSDSVRRALARKVVLHFKDGLGMMPDDFGFCEIPTQDLVFHRDSTMRVNMPRGYLDSYMTGTFLSPDTCPYGDAIVSMDLQDTMPTHDQLCQVITGYYKAKRAAPEIKIGSLSFAVSVNHAAFKPFCPQAYRAHWRGLKIKFAASLIPVKDFLLYTPDHRPITYTTDSGFIEPGINLQDVQLIEVYIKGKLFTPVKLITRGPWNYQATSHEPIQQCDLAFDKTENKRTLFVKRTGYTVIKFAKQDNVINLLNEKTNRTISINLNTLKYDPEKKAYILKRKVLRKMERAGKNEAR